MMMIELQVSPAKSTPREHFVVKRIGVSFEANSSMFSFDLFCSSLNLSWVIRLSSFRIRFSDSFGRSLKAETWTNVGGFALPSCMSRILRYFFLVIVPFLKFEKEQFSSAPVIFLLIVPGFLDSASIILKSFSPNISFKTSSE